MSKPGCGEAWFLPEALQENLISASLLSSLRAPASNPCCPEDHWPITPSLPPCSLTSLCL